MLDFLQAHVSPALCVELLPYFYSAWSTDTPPRPEPTSMLLRPSLSSTSSSSASSSAASADATSQRSALTTPSPKPGPATAPRLSLPGDERKHRQAPVAMPTWTTSAAPVAAPGRSSCAAAKHYKRKLEPSQKEGPGKHSKRNKVIP